MGLKTWYQDRQMQRTSGQIGRMIAQSTQGLPSWAVSSRMAVHTWTQATEELLVLATAVKADDVPACHASIARLDAHLADTEMFVQEITAPGADTCLNDLAYLRQRFQGGVMPGGEEIERISSWLKEVYC